MSNDGQPIAGNTRHLWEALFSLHLGFAGMSIAFIVSTAVLTLFSHMEIRINNFLNVRQTDFIKGYLAVGIASVLMAFLIWVLLRTCSRTRFAQEFLRSLAGIMTIFTPLVFWVVVYEQTFWPVGWPYEGAPFEMATALVCTMLFVSGKWKVPSWAGFLLLAAHYVYWYFAPGSNLSRPNYMGPVGPLLGLCSGVAWVRYVSRLKKVKAVVTPVVS